MDASALRARVLAANRAVVDAGLVTLTFGNASGVDRDAGVMAIKPSGVPYEELDESAIVLVELASGDVVEGTLRPSSDAPTHLVLYRRFAELGGVVHTHSPYATAWAQSGRELPCLGTTHADHFRGAVPVTRALTPAEIDGAYEEATGDVIVEALAARGVAPLEVPAALVQGHGPFAWGDGVADAVENAIALEAVAALAFRTLALDADVAELHEALRERHFTRKHGPGRYYGQS
jgi:L-ribulose-5-phosphate 4-epimerase